MPRLAILRRAWLLRGADGLLQLAVGSIDLALLRCAAFASSSTTPGGA
jgi:hypothetical protein